ncbi:MAG TPA: Rrf2 family transcriptional regulator [Paracoccaceae bacterium]
MRLTTRTNLAMRVLMFCAVNTDRIVRSAEIAAGCNASPNHLAQVVHLLSVNGFVATTRGRSGGLQLGRPAQEIMIGEVFRTFEAGLPFAECFAGEENTCPLTAACRLRGILARAVEAFYRELDRVTLQELVADNHDLSVIFAMRPEIRLPCGA